MRQISLRRILLALWIAASFGWVVLNLAVNWGDISYAFDYRFRRDELQRRDEVTWNGHVAKLREEEAFFRRVAPTEPWRSHPEMQSMLKAKQDELASLPSTPPFNPYKRTRPSLDFLVLAWLPPLVVLLLGALVWYTIRPLAAVTRNKRQP